MQIAYEQAVQAFGTERCLHAASKDAGALLAVMAAHPNGGRRDLDAMARAVADMEVRCEQLRLIVGSGLVDLHKVSSLARLQSQLRAHDERKAL